MCKAEAFLRAELDALKESTEPNELLVVQAEIALIDILFDTPVLASTTLAEATAYLEHILQYIVEISAEYQPAAVKLAIDVKMLLSRPAATAVDDHRLEATGHKCNELIGQLSSTPYSQAIDAVDKANLLMEENRPAEAERLCRYAIRAGSLTGGMELIAQRIFVEALVRQRKWQAAHEGLRNFRKYFGPTEFHLNVIADMVHNVGGDCAGLALIERDQDAASLLVDMLEPVGKWLRRLLILSFRCRYYGAGSPHREGSGLLAVAGYFSIIRSPLSHPARHAPVTNSPPAVTPSEHHQHHLPTGS